MNLLKLRSNRAFAERELLFWVENHFSHAQAQDMLTSIVCLDDNSTANRIKIKERFIGRSHRPALQALDSFVTAVKAVAEAELAALPKDKQPESVRAKLRAI